MINDIKNAFSFYSIVNGGYITIKISFEAVCKFFHFIRTKVYNKITVLFKIFNKITNPVFKLTHLSFRTFHLCITHGDGYHVHNLSHAAAEL